MIGDSVGKAKHSGMECEEAMHKSSFVRTRGRLHSLMASLKKRLIRWGIITPPGTVGDRTALPDDQRDARTTLVFHAQPRPPRNLWG